MLALLICCIVFGFLIIGSIADTEIYEKALSQHEQPEYTPNSFNMTHYFEQKKYDQALLKYHSRLMLSIFIFCMFIACLYTIFRPKKIVVSSEGICVYSVFKTAPIRSTNWQDVKSIHFGYGLGWHGMMGSFGVHLHTGVNDKTHSFVPTHYYKDENNMHRLIETVMKGRCEITYDTVFKNSTGPVKMLIEGYRTLKSNYKSYYIYSMIASIFLFMQQYVKETPVLFIAAWASIYWGYRAFGALYYHVFCDYNNLECNFDKSWEYSHSLVGRIIGATVIQSIGVLFCGLAILYTIGSKIDPVLKLGLITIFIMIACLWTIRFILLPYIAAIINENTSYISINAQMMKGHLGGLIILSAPILVKSIGLVVFLILKFEEIRHGLSSIEHIIYFNLLVNFILVPFYATCAMYLLKTLPNEIFSGGQAHEETL
jgi:hypothetical protein